MSFLTTPAGAALVHTRQERRKNHKLRAMACRDALLDWCYTVGDVANLAHFPDEVRAHFEGDPFTEEEIEQASIDLKEKGFVQGSGTLQGGIIKPRVTAERKAVVETHGSSISDYERGQRPANGQAAINITTGTLSGQLVLGDHNRVLQTSHTSGFRFRRR